MLEIKNVQGSQISVPEVEVNVDTVYVRSNIHRIQVQVNDDPVNTVEFWEYDEIQYTYREYLQLLGDEKIQYQKDLNATQEAIDFLMLNNVNINMLIENKDGENNMTITPINYIVNRIEKEYKLHGLEKAKQYYNSYFNLDTYLPYKEEVNKLLKEQKLEKIYQK